jgi:sorbitol-6-phosphate 2-dehydrogenase
MDERPLLNSNAIVTGGAQGLGAAICARLAQEGAHVLVADLNEAGAQQTAQAIHDATGRYTSSITVDVTDEVQVQRMVAHAVDTFGGVDILVANAGIVMSGPVDEFDAARWRKVIDVNLVGYFLCAKHVVPVMKAQHSGVIVQINSKSGKKGSMKNSAYAASKFGGIGLTQSLALELAEHGVRVNAVCPGNLLDSPLWSESLYAQYAERLGITEEEVRQRYVDQVPMKRGCTYEDVTNAVVFLASNQSNYMTGQAINVTGGQEMR